jgi:hypothetical protein
MKKETDALGPRFGWLREMVSEIVKDYGQIKEASRECGARYQELGNKLRQRDEGQRKNNIIFFGLQEKREQNSFETLCVVVKWLSESMKAETTIENTVYVARLGSRRGERPILITFTSFSKKMQLFKNKRNLPGSKVRPFHRG